VIVERSSVEVICPRCGVPFTRHGPPSSHFYRTADENDVCVICREGLPAAEWLPPATS
jgi:hypothetical protein